MSNLPITANLEHDWQLNEDGSGAHSYSLDGFRGNFSSGAGTGKSYVYKRVPARPGEKITVTVLARLNSGSASLAIDYPTQGALKSIMEITQPEWKEYSVSYAIPHTADVTSDYVQIAIGTITSDAGNVDIVGPKITSAFGEDGFSRVYCMGLVELNRQAGVTTPTINTNFHHSGIFDLSYSVANKELTVRTIKTLTTGGQRVRPIFNVGATFEVLPDLQVKAGQYSPSTGEFKIKFSNATGSFVDINSLLSDGQSIYIFVKAEGL